MKARQGICMLVLLTFFLLGIVGCQSGETVEAEYNIFYLNKEATKLVPVAYEPTAETDTGMLEDMIDKLNSDSGSVEYRKPLAGGVEILSATLTDGQLLLNFSSDYSQMDHITEVLCRAAIVRTLIQVASVDSISFSVGDIPLMDANGKPVGLMTADSFIENPGEQINTIQTATITLYFSNPEGNGLVEEIQERHYNSNISLEKLVMELLMKGPIQVEGKSVIPSGTKLVNVSVLDGVCFVNLDEGFLNQNYEIEEGVVIYSIVNSLVELPNVNKVQISVNGDTDMNYRENFSLSNVYVRDLDYLKVEEPVDTTQGEENEVQLEEIEGAQERKVE